MNDFDCCDNGSHQQAFRLSSSASVGDPHIQVTIDASGNYEVVCQSGDPRPAIHLLRFIADDLVDYGEATSESGAGA